MPSATLAEGTRLREARLLPQHAHRYPGLPPDRWEPAATLADRVLAGWLLRGTTLTLRGRTLTEAHFEFRGGVERAVGGAGGRPRREDR